MVSSLTQTRQAERFSRIAGRYDAVNRVASLGLSRGWTRACAEAVAECRRMDADGIVDDAHPLAGCRVLDVACGTGESSRALAALGADVTGCDISPGMLAVARAWRPRNVCDMRVAQHIRESGGHVRYVTGDAMSPPFPDGLFDIVTCSYGLRNMPDRTRALREMWRVTKFGGALVLLDFDTPDDSLMAFGYRIYNATILPLVGGALTGHPGDYRYLADSIGEWPGRRGMARMAQEAGWQGIAVRPLSHGIAALCRARKPFSAANESFRDSACS